ncbi:cytidyltransferase [Tindallia californiensis]|uniref:nicotinate-nucleotide adenylyltransferase n=1 Tax=Tindallia californiensis TaxID=159292 RepID=A0A1H3JM47_9FIRM|nr:cytidyltransferase [Tindallia californiensis]SDY40294.1 Nicotinic acid mononucleotide adenylyltransferase [Tindallia californiensis]
MKTYQDFHKMLSTRLLNASLLENIEIEASEIDSFLKEPSVIKKMKKMIADADYSCKTVYNLLKPIILNLWNQAPPKDPLNYLYQYALSMSFPHAVETELDDQYSQGCLFYLEGLKVVTEIKKTNDQASFQGKHPLRLSVEELGANTSQSKEYRQFLLAFEKEYIHEMMRLNFEVTHHNTLDHICGVHYLAVLIAKQLFELGIPVDVGRVSGAAAGHDLGKFGCRSFEASRVAYLHYYYTEQWFKNREIFNIGHVALNHSVWDLELENLPLESLILIYADFRVKNKSTVENPFTMSYFSLADSFSVILSKLDNLDEAKEKRYQRVYAKLKDFEDYMIDLGIQTDPSLPMKTRTNTQKKYYSLMHGTDVTQNLKYFAIHHNIHLLYRFRDEDSLSEIIELARNEKNDKILRKYLDLFQEYNAYFTQKQKIVSMRFFYEKLTHPEEDIRRQCAELIGQIISQFDENYRKELPGDVELPPPDITSFDLLSEYMKLFIFPDHKITDLHTHWIQYSLTYMVSQLFSCCDQKDISQYKDIIVEFFLESQDYSQVLDINFLQTIPEIPVYPGDPTLNVFFDYIRSSLKHPSLREDLDLRMSVLESLNYLIDYFPHDSQQIEFVKSIFTDKPAKSPVPAENYMMLRIAKKLFAEDAKIRPYQEFYELDVHKVPDIHLTNLKTATNWVTKRIHVELLLDYLSQNPTLNKLYTAMHFCNLLKVSSVENVRIQAGESLVKLFPELPMEQRNDVAIELLRALEIDGAQHTKYIPDYLGQIIIYLKQVEIDEILMDLTEKIKQGNSEINSLLIKTIGIFVENFPKYQEFFNESEDEYDNRLRKMMGVLLNGLVHNQLQIQQISFSVLGKDIFGSTLLTLKEKELLFKMIAKKMLTLTREIEEHDLLFLTNSSSLNHIYRFISDFAFFHAPIEVPVPDKIAFFPGSFDPFTLGHKEITTAIRNKGFEVYLAIDEFSWSKRTQPNLVRKNIANMSIADELHVFIFPEELPINLANNTDLKKLKSLFQISEVYLVAGSDVLINASAYRSNKDSPILDFGHILFERRNADYSPDHHSRLNQLVDKISKPVIRLNLAPQYEDISSSQIRSYIDENRDISKMIDPLCQHFIYKQNLYRNEPQYKSLIQTISLDIDIRDHFTYELINSIVSSFHDDYNHSFKNVEAIFRKPNGRLILIRDVKQNGKVLAYAAIHWVPSEQIYQEFKNREISGYVREEYNGRIIAIDGIFANQHHQYDNLYQIILTETLAYALKNDYGYAIFQNKIDQNTPSEVFDILQLHGFIELDYGSDKEPVLTVNMSNPCTLNLDIMTIIKEPFKSNHNVQKAINHTRKRMQKVLTELYPGHLTLSFDRSIIDETLIKKICHENEVPPVPLNPRKLGEAMCVPFGNVLNRTIVPNTVTKSLHTERMFNPDMKSFTIRSFPYYLDLKHQIRMINSFNKPVILVDDLLNKGYRIRGLDPLLKEENLAVKKIVVGLLSGRGKELMEIQNRAVDSAYFIPKLRLWFNEALLYPFIGGDYLWRGSYPNSNLMPSINQILPYTSPSFIKGVSNRQLYNMSQVCIENSIAILHVLEKEYQKLYERKLTLSMLGEVFIYPRYPDNGPYMKYDFSIAPSEHLKKDLELLQRLELMVITS